MSEKACKRPRVHKRQYRDCYFCGANEPLMVCVDMVDNIFYCLECKKDPKKMRKIDKMIRKFHKKHDKKKAKEYEKVIKNG